MAFETPFIFSVGGKESRTYGIDMKTGRIIYECTLQGCNRDPREPDDEMEDVLVVQVKFGYVFLCKKTIN